MDLAFALAPIWHMGCAGPRPGLLNGGHAGDDGLFHKNDCANGTGRCFRVFHRRILLSRDGFGTIPSLT